MSFYPEWKGKQEQLPFEQASVFSMERLVNLG